MQIYHYNRDTKEYVCSSEARLDPLEWEINKIERWLLPAHATFDAPPECPEGKMLIYGGMIVQGGDGWQVVDIPKPPEPEPVKELTKEEIEAQVLESLIQAKMREQAVEALKVEGKLTAEGKMVAVKAG